MMGLGLLLSVSAGFAGELIRFDFETGSTAVNTADPALSATVKSAGMSVAADDAANAKFGSGRAKAANSAVDYFSVTDLTGPRAVLNQPLSSFSFSIFVKPEAGAIGKDLTLFARRPVLANKAGEVQFYWLGDGRPRLKYFTADGVMVMAASGTVAPDLFKAGQYTQLGVTFDSESGKVIFYLNGKPYSRTISVGQTVIPEITLNPNTAYMRFAAAAAGAGTVYYDNVIFDAGTVYTEAQMAAICEKGQLD